MTDRPVDRLLDALQAQEFTVRPRGGYWSAQCPAHDDRNPSLSIRVGDRQPVLLDCKAGCDPNDVIAALGLTWPDLCNPREDDHPGRGEWTPHGPATAVYDYADENGVLLYQVLRTAGKQFPVRVPDATAKRGWRWKLGETRRVLYRLPDVIDAVAAGNPVFVVEGEKDADMLARHGVTATCNPGGAGKWRPEFSDFFKGADVTVVQDRDDPGREHAAAVAADLVDVARTVRVVEAAEGKDATDHINAGYAVADLVAPVTLSESQKPATSENDTSDGSDTDQSQAEMDVELLGDVRDGVWLDSQKFPPLQWAVPGLLPEGMTILVGPPKAGKSWFIGNILLGVAAGAYAVGKLQVGKARRVLYLALEDGDRRMQSRCRIILGESPIPSLFHYKTTVPPGKVMAVMGAWLRRHPDTAMIVLDTLGRVMPPAFQGESQYQRDYRIGAELKAVADSHPGLAVVVVHHDRKAAAEDFVDAVSGTNGLAGSADAVIVLARKRKAEDAVLKVTGKDVPEAEYALRLVDGTNWVLDGENLTDAAERAEKRQDEAAVSDTSMEIINFIRRQPDRTATAKDLADRFGGDVYTYLKRHTEAGRLNKPSRGVYVVP